MRVNPQSRVLQFAAYTFDVSIGDMFTTLIRGGCVCVPSEQQRLDVGGAIRKFKANQACLTSSVARHLHASKNLGLETLTIGGEPLSAEVVKAWAEHTTCLISTVLQNVRSGVQLQVSCP